MIYLHDAKGEQEVMEFKSNKEVAEFLGIKIFSVCSTMERKTKVARRYYAYPTDNKEEAFKHYSKDLMLAKNGCVVFRGTMHSIATKAGVDASKAKRAYLDKRIINGFIIVKDLDYNISEFTPIFEKIDNTINGQLIKPEPKRKIVRLGKMGMEELKRKLCKKK